VEEFGGFFHSFHGEHGKMMVKDVGNTHTEVSMRTHVSKLKVFMRTCTMGI